MKVHRQLDDRLGDDMLMMSISIDGEDVDTVEKMRAYDKATGGPRKGWYFLTGDYDEVDYLRHSLGVYDPDPVIDADKTQHSGLLTYGNDSTDYWAALPALSASDSVVRAILRTTRRRSPSGAQGINPPDKG